MVFPTVSPGPPVSTLGWTCTLCGAWVQKGGWHSCSGGSGTDAATPQPLIINQDDEIIQKLDRIIELLEKEIDKEK